MDSTNEIQKSTKLITIKKRFKSKLASLSPDLSKKLPRIPSLPKLSDSETSKASLTSRPKQENEKVLNKIKSKFANSLSKFSANLCYCGSSDISEQDISKISKIHDSNQRSHCESCPLSRDVSHTKDRPEKLKNLFNRSQNELKEVLGLKEPEILMLPLPTELDKLQNIVNKDNESAKNNTQVIKITESPIKNEVYNMDDFYHEKFMKDLEIVKRKSNKFIETKISNLAKEGGLLFKTQSGLIQARLTQISEEKPPNYAGNRSKSIGNPSKVEKNINLNTERGAPSGRREVELLCNWLDYMLDKYVYHTEFATIENKTEALQLIYTACFKEIIRQVSVHCIERGQLLNRIWNSNFELNSKNKNKFSEEIEDLKQRFKELVSKNQKNYEEKLNVVTKKYSDINGELRKSSKVISEQSQEIESLRNELNEEKAKAREINMALQTLTRQQNVSIIQWKSRDEKGNLINPVSYRTVSTCTMEDEKILQPIDEEPLEFTRRTSFKREFSLPPMFMSKHRERSTFTGDDKLFDNIVISKEKLDYLNSRAILLENFEEFTISPAFNCEQVNWMSTLIKGFRKFITNYISNMEKNKKELLTLPPLSENEEEHEVTLVICKSATSQESNDENFEKNMENNEEKVKIEMVEIETQTEFDRKKEIKTYIDVIEIDREKLNFTGQQLAKYEKKIESLSLSKIFVKIIGDLIKAASDVVGRQSKMMKQTQEFFKKLPNEMEEKENRNEEIKIDEEKYQENKDGFIKAVSEHQKSSDKAENREEYKNNLSQTLENSTNSLNLTQKVNFVDDSNFSNLLGKIKKLKTLINSYFSNPSNLNGDISEEILKKEANKLRISIDNLFDKDINKSHYPVSLCTQTDFYEDNSQFKEENKSTIIIPEEEEKNSAYNIEDRIKLSSRQWHKKIATKPRQFANKKQISKKHHPSSKILLLAVQKAERKPNLKPTLSKKTLMKLIYSMYTARTLLIDEYPSIKKVDLCEMIYDELLQKYGLKSVAEDKFKEVILSAICYSESSNRVRNFLKFVGVYGDYKIDDLDFYLKTVEFINTTNIGTFVPTDDGASDLYIPYSKAIASTKSLFEEKLSKEEWENLKNEIDTIKEPSDSLKKGALNGDSDKICIDSLLEVLIGHYQNLKNKSHEFY
ncbi:unnamed protein product [Blepharisma stoltei]|uniref:Uncharacterized protein n=1 Tax=Blepharisma stoltei TaxID=1481888 RepID=A0AAU9JWU1_9CILI|nr:unnamed protein product [Blepharisma stoltei]